MLTLLPETSFQWPLGHQISVASVEKTVLGLGAPRTPNRMLLKIEVAPGLMLGNMGRRTWASCSPLPAVGLSFSVCKMAQGLVKESSASP